MISRLAPGAGPRDPTIGIRVGVVALATRTWLAGGVVAAGLLVAQAVPAGAAPATPAPSASSSATTSSSPPLPAGTPPTRKPTGPKPAATAPPAPVDPGPACTTGADAQYPVVCLPAGSGEDRSASLTPGEDIEFDAQVVNNGPAVAGSTVVITLPVGLELESDEDDPVYRIDGWYDSDGGDFTDLTCRRAGSTITCAVGALAAHANILVGVDLQVAADAQPGTTLRFQVALQPAGTDTYPPTSVEAGIEVLTPTHLVVSLTPATLRTVVGQHATMTGIVHNAGPGAAPSTVAVGIAVDENDPNGTHFTITNGTDVSAGDGSLVFVGGSSRSPLRARLQRQASARRAKPVRRHAEPAVRFWPLGTIAAGATERVQIDLQALTVGTDELSFGALSASGGDCEGDGGDAEAGSGSATPSEPALARAPQPVSTTTAPADCAFVVDTHITAVPAAAPLADTGAHQLTGQVVAALWALVSGAALVWAGRRRKHGGNARESTPVKA